jgi:hypothetical protein
MLKTANAVCILKWEKRYLISGIWVLHQKKGTRNALACLRHPNTITYCQQFNLLLRLTTCFLKIHLNITLLSFPSFPQRFHPPRFSQ